jgi:hypothetical protein
MNKEPFETSPESGDGPAINRVLAAERAAQQAVTLCERQARDLLSDAQARVRRIQQRCDDRIRFIHMRCAQRLAEYARHRDTSTVAEQPDIRAPGAETLAAAVEQLAAELGGTAGEDE